MRESLVAPYSLTMATGESDAGQVSTRDVVIVADDHDQALLAFDPIPRVISLLYGGGSAHSLYRTFAEMPLDAF